MLSPAFHHVSPCFFSQDGRKGETETQYVDRLIDEYEQLFQQLDPNTVAAVILEPIVGATLGSVPAAKGYLARIRGVCDKYGALLIFDEVMCGMGRAGTLHAWESLGGVRPDLQVIGKGLGAGYQPISGMLIAHKVHERIEAASSTQPFVSGHTYQGHSIGCAAALATQQTIIKDDLLENVKLMSERLRETLTRSTPCLKEVRGLGLFLTAAFSTPSGRKIAPEVAAECFEHGAAVYLCSPSVDAVMFAPPFIISEDEIDLLASIFTDATAKVLERHNQDLA